MAASIDHAKIARSIGGSPKGKHGGGGSTKNPVRQAVMADCAAAGISERTAKMALHDHSIDQAKIAQSMETDPPPSASATSSTKPAKKPRAKKTKAAHQMGNPLYRFRCYQCFSFSSAFPPAFGRNVPEDGKRPALAAGNVGMVAFEAADDALGGVAAEGIRVAVRHSQGCGLVMMVQSAMKVTYPSGMSDAESDDWLRTLYTAATPEQRAALRQILEQAVAGKADEVSVVRFRARFGQSSSDLLAALDDLAYRQAVERQ